MKKSNKELRKILGEEEYKVIVEKGTEMPFTGEYLHNDKNGQYNCLVCESELFTSETKFDSGSGWPSFSDVVSNENVEIKEDDSHGMSRLEVLCNTCGAHLGHLFNDGPTPTGKRYCINSVCLKFQPK